MHATNVKMPHSCSLHTSCLQVAERSLFLWNNDYIVTLVAQHRHVILPVVFNALESNARSHWNPAVHGLTSNVKKVFQDMDMVLWRECEAHYQQEEVWWHPQWLCYHLAMYPVDNCICSGRCMQPVCIRCCYGLVTYSNVA